MVKNLKERMIEVDEGMAAFSSNLSHSDAASEVQLGGPSASSGSPPQVEVEPVVASNETPIGATAATANNKKPWQQRKLKTDIYRNWAESEGSASLKKMKSYFLSIQDVVEVEVK